MVSLSVDLHLSKAKLSLFCDSNYFLIASTVSAYYLREMFGRVMWMAALGHCIMLYMTLVARDLIQRSMKYEPKRNLTWGSDSTCPGELRKFKVLRCKLWAFCLSFGLIWIYLDVKYDFSLWTYHFNSLTFLPFQVAQSCLSNHRTSEFSNLWIC